MTDRVGFIGLGDIGLPIATRLQSQIGAITVWNRTASKAKRLLYEGARFAPDLPALVAECRLIALCLKSDDVIEEVVFGENGLLAVHAPGRVIINLSTGTPERSQQFAARTRSAGSVWLDAPVSGGVPAARNGTLTVFLGGDEETVTRAEPVLAAISAKRTLMGPIGAGQATKLCNQMIVAINLLAIAEAIATGRKAGIDVASLAEALGGGFADSSPLQIFGPRMAVHAFTPRLGAVSLMLKDVGAVLAMIGEPAPASILATAYSIYQSAIAPERDLSTLIELYEPTGS